MSNDPFFSIAIPCYEANGKGCYFLEKQFELLKQQSFQDFEIVISDNSQNNEIEKFCEKNQDFLKINHFYYFKKGNSPNTNYALKKSKGKYIKIIFQDDFLYSKNSLLDIKNELQEKTMWLITACEHSYDGFSCYRPFKPYYHDDIHKGNNTISSPSVLTIKNTDEKIFFDENLSWLMDVDYYKRCFIKFGLPHILNKINIVNRTHNDQFSNYCTEAVKQKEYNYILKKYSNNE